MTFNLKKIVTEVAKEQATSINIQVEAKNLQKNNTFVFAKPSKTFEEKKSTQQKTNDTIKENYRPEQKINSEKDSTFMKERDQRFEKFIPYVEESEGGYVNDPDDPGGATNRGIAWDTWVTYAKPILGIEPTVENLKALSKEDANKIYKKVFWEGKKIHKINNEKIAFTIFDWGGELRKYSC